MSRVSNERSRVQQRSDVMHFAHLLAISAVAASLAACGSGGSAEAARVDTLQQRIPQQATLPEKLCDLLPRADAERIMSKALVEQRNDNSACHYQDARGTSGTSLMLDLNAFSVGDQCRLTPHSEPLSGVGSEACIAVGVPSGSYTTLTFGGGGRTFDVTAPREDKAPELPTAVARAVLSKLGR